MSAPTQAQVQAALDDAGSIIAGLTPILGAYGPAILLALSVADKVAPEIYGEILILIQKQQQTSSDQDARIKAMIADLKNPAADFSDSPGSRRGSGRSAHAYMTVALLTSLAICTMLNCWLQSDDEQQEQEQFIAMRLGYLKYPMD